MHIASPGVVPQTRPQMEYVIDRGVRQGPHCRKSGLEALEVGNDGSHLRLLEHDLRDPDPGRGAMTLPREVVATLAGVPGNQGICDCGFAALCSSLAQLYQVTAQPGSFGLADPQ